MPDGAIFLAVGKVFRHLSADWAKCSKDHPKILHLERRPSQCGFRRAAPNGFSHESSTVDQYKLASTSNIGDRGLGGRDLNFNTSGVDPNMGRRSFAFHFGEWVPLVALPSSICLPTEISEGQIVALAWHQTSLHTSYLHTHICSSGSRLNVSNSNYALSTFQHRLKL